jgi:acetoin utilization protein AcuB
MAPKKPERIPAVVATMTPFPWFIHIDDRLSRAKEMMAEHEIRHLPVTEDGELVGVLDERDLRLVASRTDAKQLGALTVADACMRDAYVVDVSEPLDQVLMEMARRHIGSALVVKHGKLVGIFTGTDACRAFGELLRDLFPDPGADEVA